MRSYLVTKLPNYFIESIRFLREVFSLRKKILCRLQNSFAFSELIHGESHGGHILSSLHYIVIFLCKTTPKHSNILLYLRLGT